MGGTLRFILGDQLSLSISSLKDANPKTDTIILAEVAEEATYVPHHRQKIIFIFSAMRHFAEDLRAQGFDVLYYKFDEARLSSFTQALENAIKAVQPERIVVTEAGEYRVQQMLESWCAAFALPVEIREDTRFFATKVEFARWAEGRKSLRMEFFYREMRRKYALLMENGKPVGGEWNYDAENRKSPPAHLQPPPVPTIKPDAITQEVMRVVVEAFPDGFGAMDTFAYAVSPADAMRIFEHFIHYKLPYFGDYQDAMVEGQPFLYHAVISLYLNTGLLDPKAVCQRVEAAYYAGEAPLNAVEGFIRQILGWREYVRGIYWLKMPEYATLNTLGYSRPLPSFYWTGKTDMNCMKNAIGQTIDYAYAHHIQRLMVTGNFAMLAGITPKEICDWYLAVYIDAFEWVELPNTLGMVMHADKGYLGSKPYVSSGKYIDRMSNYCLRCAYSVKNTTEDNACPFNFLYWNFLARHRAQFGGNTRMAMIYRTWDKMAEDKQLRIIAKADSFLAHLGVA